MGRSVIINGAWRAAFCYTGDRYGGHGVFLEWATRIDAVNHTYDRAYQITFRVEG
jgi:hypothetical protein